MLTIEIFVEHRLDDIACQVNMDAIVGLDPWDALCRSTAMERR